MSWPPNIEKYRTYVEWECKDLPPDLMLAVIQHESGGVAGAIGKGETKWGSIPSTNSQSGKVNVNHALGLCQVIPPNVESWNENPNNETVYLEDMTGTDERAIRLQIRLGCWIMASGFHGLSKFYPENFVSSGKDSNANEIRLALVAYAIGIGALKEKLDQLKAEGKALTYEQLAESFPDWGKSSSGKWVNRPLFYARNVWDKYAEATGGTKTPASSKVGKVWAKGGWIVVPLAMAFIWAFVKREKE